jgi:hypothetical protein
VETPTATPPVRIVQLSDDDRSAMRRIMSNAVANQESNARIVGIYVDPPGVCIAVE